MLESSIFAWNDLIYDLVGEKSQRYDHGKRVIYIAGGFLGGVG
jgi:hypothetical protein